MPASETPTNPSITEQSERAPQLAAVAEPEGASAPEMGEGSGPPPLPPRPESPAPTGRSSSRYVDYETHELLEKITQYEDERRWQRIREGIWISILLHILLFSSVSWIPRYIFHSPQVIDPFDAIKKRKDLTYLDELPDALKQLQKVKPKLPPLKPNETVVDKKTLDALKALEKARPKPAPPAPEQTQVTPPPQPAIQLPQPQQPTPLPPTTAAPQPAPTLPLDTPRPAPVPARPNFKLDQQSAADQLKNAMRDSAHGASGEMRGGGMHPGADGGAEILSDTQGIDFGPYLQKLIRETHRTWDPIIPEEVNPPISKRGECEIVFTILPNGRLQPHAMMLTGRSGDVALDRAAWGAIESADYPPLPREFHGPNLQLRFRFQYNIR
jgi:outer membrane biosynthesis protein TonB